MDNFSYIISSTASGLDGLDDVKGSGGSDNNTINTYMTTNISKNVNSSQMLKNPYEMMDEMGMVYLFDIPEVRIIFIILYTIVFCSCFFGNLMVILVVCLHWKMRSITNFCLANLAIADFCVSVFCIYQNLSNYLIQSWILGNFMCKMYSFVDRLSHTASILILVVICIERYLAIIHPMQCKQMLTLTRLRLVIITVWILSAIINSPRLYYFHTISHQFDDEVEIICGPDRRLFDSKTSDIVNLIVLYLIPLILISVLYMKIAIVLWRSSRPQIQNSYSTEYSSNSSGGGPSTLDNVETIYKNRGSSNGNCVKNVNGETSFTSQPKIVNPHCPSPPKKGQQQGQQQVIDDARNSSGSCESGFCDSDTTISKNKRKMSISIQTNEPIVVLKMIDKISKKPKKSALKKSLRKNHFQGRGDSTKLCNGTGNIGKCTGNGRKKSFCSSCDGHQQNGNFNTNNLSLEESPESPGPSPKELRFEISDNVSNFSKYSGKMKGSISDENVCETPPHTPVSPSPIIAAVVPRLKRMRVIRGSKYGSRALESRRRVIKMLIVIVLAFAICNLPFHSRKMWQYFGQGQYLGGSNISTLYTVLSTLIMFSNSAINPLLYVFYSSSKFRACFLDLLYCRMRPRNIRRRQNHLGSFRSRNSEVNMNGNIITTPALQGGIEQ